jgi:hypothetical protein
LHTIPTKRDGQRAAAFHILPAAFNLIMNTTFNVLRRPLRIALRVIKHTS